MRLNEPAGYLKLLLQAPHHANKPHKYPQTNDINLHAGYKAHQAQGTADKTS